MKTLTHVLRLAAASLLCLATFLHANPSAPGASAAEIVSFKFTVFSPDRLPPVFILGSSGQPAAPLAFVRNLRSAEATYTGPLPLVFWREDLSAPGGRVEVARLTTPPPANTSRALLFFSPAGAGRYGIQPFRDDDGSLPRNHINIINASGARLAAQIGGTQTFLEIGQSPPFPADGDLRIKVALRVEDRVVLGLDRVIDLLPGERTTIVVLPPLSKDRPLLGVRMLKEAAPPEPLAAAL